MNERIEVMVRKKTPIGMKVGQYVLVILTVFLFLFSLFLGIFNISVIVPAIGFGALAAVLWFWYPLHKKTVDANIAELKSRRGE